MRKPPNSIMTPCTNNPNAHREGVVLMELVLSISLFLVLVGGTMWVGELYLARNKLMIADRYAVWNGGNRHFKAKGFIQGTIQEELFPPERVGSQEIAGITWERGPAERWYFPVGSTVLLVAEMPMWTRGWLASGAWWTPPRFPYPVRVFTGRDEDAADPPSHAAMMVRSKHGEEAYRTWHPRDLVGIRGIMPPPNPSAVWNLHVYREPWPELSEMQGSSAGDMAFNPPPPPPVTGTEYRRFNTYETWSR